MKRVFAISLAILMFFSLAACNKKESERDTVNQIFGTVTGQTYENKFIGIGCKLDSDWTFKLDKEIEEMNQIATDAMGDELANAVADADIYYDMYATGYNALDSININLEKAPNLKLFNLDLSENYKQAFPMLKSGLENMGYRNITYTIGTITIDGQSFTCMRVHGLYSYGIDFYELLFCVKCDGYLANITIGTFFEDATDDLVECFYLIK